MRSTWQRKFAIVTGASSGIGLELAKLAARTATTCWSPPTRRWSTRPRRSKDLGVEVRVGRGRPRHRRGRRPAARRGRRPADRRARRQCRPRPRPRLPRPGPDRVAARHRHQHHRHALSDPAGRAARWWRANEGKILITGSIAGHIAGQLPGGLQRHQGVHRQLLRRARQRAQGHRGHGHLPEAGRDRDRVLRARRHAWTPRSAHAKKDDPADVAKTGWEAMKDGKRSVVHGLKNKLQVAAMQGRSAAASPPRCTARKPSRAPPNKAASRTASVELRQPARTSTHAYRRSERV